MMRPGKVSFSFFDQHVEFTDEHPFAKLPIPDDAALHRELARFVDYFETNAESMRAKHSS